MTKLLHTVILLLCLVIFAGCDHQELPSQAKIQVNVPDEPYPGTRTKVITFDVDTGREAFVQLFNSTKRLGMCSPTKIEESNGAHEVMTVSYWGDAVKDRLIFYILKNPEGEWITTGYGGVEIYDHPEGFPQYRYTKHALRGVKAWYEEHVPQSDRKR
jgi:hypothetical protein